ncbi:MAG: hypothetical protein AVDCRST_MAG43-768 [uncultured Thermomicrobiales bacterium]|uniref:Uncharacterized protein n=1 Tax=uncultured Thermomicrobiales bacterium TaxID=1645740 RepID=A0A6J4UGH2_9BACT|nr:MAG: hypothetical protein AVDCRST_MAG43-768 [uncultured Thermomicrobiales bacterium]
MHFAGDLSRQGTGIPQGFILPVAVGRAGSRRLVVISLAGAPFQGQEGVGTLVLR